MSEEQGHKEEVAPASPEIHFQPIVSLPKVEIKSLEENEEEIFQMRAKLYRYHKTEEETLWKERGVGTVKILKHKVKEHTYRLLMRRDKTLKICANHIITTDMDLKENCGSDRAWVWTVGADYADETPSPETLAIKFGNAENAKKFKDAFVDCQRKVEGSGSQSDEKESEKLAQELEGLTVKEGETVKEGAEAKTDDNETKTETIDTETDKKTETTDTEKADEPKTEEDTPEK